MRKWMAMLLCAVMLTGLLACGVAERPEEGAGVWFVSDSDRGSSALDKESYGGVLDVPHLMDALLAGPTGEELRSAIPQDTRLLAWNVTGRTASVDLSGDYNSLTGVELTLANYCIVLTLTQIEGIELVRITVNGGELPYGGGVLLSESDVLFSGAEEVPVELTAALCFRLADSDELGVELRVFRLTESQSATEAVLRALVEGPREEGLVGLMPEGVEVYSARMDDGICYADFSGQLLSEELSQLEQDLIYRSISESLCSLGYVKGVQLLVEGEALATYGSQSFAPQ